MLCFFVVFSPPFSSKANGNRSFAIAVNEFIIPVSLANPADDESLFKSLFYLMIYLLLLLLCYPATAVIFNENTL